MKKFLFLISGCLLLFSISLTSQDRPLPADKDVVIGTLDNGMKYYIQKNSKPEKRAELRLYVKAGSVLENDNQQGLAHFVEHMAFNGTKNFAKNELINYLEKLGIKFGPEVNAYTSFDQTVYILTVPTDSLDILANGFSVLEDWAHNLSFDPVEIDKERGVLVEEWRLGRGAQMRMLDKQLPILFKGSKYAERLTIGKKEILESADYQTIKDFYHDWYRPDLFAVAAVGDFNIDEIKGYIEQHFGKLTSPAGKRESIIFDVPKHKETYFAIASDVEAQYSTCALYYLQDPKIINTVSGYRNNLAHEIFYGMLNNRLNELTSSSHPPFAYGFSGSQKFIKPADVTFLVAMVREGEIEKGFEALLREAERVNKFGFTQSELNRQTKSMLRAAEQSFAEKDKTESSDIIRQFEMNFLFDEPLVSVDDRYNLAKEILPLITLDEVNAVASELLSSENRVVLINTPEKEGVPVPKETELAAAIDKINSEQITAYEDKIAAGPLVKDIPAPTPVILSVSNTALDMVTWTLGNGVKVILKPTNFKNDEILFTAFSPGGSSMVKDEDFLSASNATDLVEESGLEGITRPELEKYLAGKIVEVHPYIGFYDEGLRGGGSPKDLETLLQLIYSYFTKPQIDSTGYSSYMTKMKSYLANRIKSPQAAFMDTLQATTSNYHFRSRPVTIEMLNEINPVKSLEIYKDRFGDAGDFTFMFTGNIDTSSIRPMIETYIGGLPTRDRTDVPVDLKYINIKGSISKEVRMGIEQKSSVATSYIGDMDFSRKEEYIMQSLADILRIKLRDAIREEKGGTYNIYCYNRIYRFPAGHYDINFGFGCDPNRVDELVAAFHNVLDSIRTFGPDETVMIKIKESQRRQRELDLKENNFWRAIISDYLENKDDLSNIQDYNKWIDELTADDIKECAAKYLGDDVVKVVLYPGKGI